MDLNKAIEVKNNARRIGSVNFTKEQMDEFNKASDIVHSHRMYTDEQYRRLFRDNYNRLAVGICKAILVGTV